jgi:hypothetical protein
VLDVLTVVALAFVATRLFGGTRLLARRDVRDHIADILRGLRLRHFVLCWPVLIAVIVAASALLYVPGLSWGWWSAIGGVGSPVLGMTERDSGSAFEWVIPLVFVLMLLPALPLFAEAEERRFRAGAENWSPAKRVARAMQFGLVHCLIGIPIGVGLALSIGGGYFTWAYLRGGIPESTRAHLAYNMTVFVIIATAFAVDALVT